MQQIKAFFRRWAAARRARRVTLADARQRVCRGAAYLDDVAPGWHDDVDADTLALGSGHRCVLGQLHGDFRVGLVRAHLLNLSSAPRASLSPVAFGFQCVGGLSEGLQARDYAHLDEAWREAIRTRQRSGSGEEGAAEEAPRPPQPRAERRQRRTRASSSASAKAPAEPVAA